MHASGSLAGYIPLPVRGMFVFTLWGFNNRNQPMNAGGGGVGGFQKMHLANIVEFGDIGS